jgi:hypothetical protein
MNDVSQPGKAVENESHYHSKKDRVFVRGIQGQYSLKDELARLRDMPRVRKAEDIRFRDGPADLEPPLRRARRTASRRPSTCTSRSTARAGARRSTAT